MATHEANESHLTERQVKLLRMYATQTGLSVAEVLRRCVNEWLEETEQLILMLVPYCTKKEQPMTTWKDGGDCGRIYREIVNEDEGHVIAKVRTKRYAFHRPAFTPTIPWPEGEANFRLILNAPRALEALEAIRDKADCILKLAEKPVDMLHWGAVKAKAVIAIAAVKGEDNEAG